MRLQTLFSFLGAAVACFDLATAAPMDTNEKTWNKRSTTYTQHCTPDNLNGINAAVVEAKAMLNVVILRTTDFYNWLENLNNGANLDIRNEVALLRSTARTFESIFGFVWFSAGDARNAPGLARVKFILDFATKFSNGLDTFWNNGQFEVYCSDDWLKTVAPDGSVSTTPFVYWDGRTTSTNQMIKDYRSSGGGVTLSDKANTQYASGQVNLDEFQGSTYTSALLHELSHARMIIGENEEYLDDKACTVPGKTGSAYGWDCISHLAQSNADEAIKNADSWTYYVTALAFQKNDWSTGVSNIL
ncbi:uncharacterized protein N7482_002458 [Penicillium canariense]|uniref:Lysine-specific metallo-endopeptidase domain-containing protein n=1 Tax=Penicillium canariense TaxID=189055 RepID=A0A9W9IJ25_9EURO|nr:uncharacterized protein N7482_002458 [Penicillium canariense]KAJ5176581.1 hypothetical protein N7482_002458 [Penicillium canariense]